MTHPAIAGSGGGGGGGPGARRKPAVQPARASVPSHVDGFSQQQVHGDCSLHVQFLSSKVVLGSTTHAPQAPPLLLLLANEQHAAAHAPAGSFSEAGT